MYFLHLLEQIRTPLLNNIMLFLTRGGEEIVFIVMVMVLLWCVNKNSAYMLLLVGLTGSRLYLRPQVIPSQVGTHKVLWAPLALWL